MTQCSHQSPHQSPDAPVRYHHKFHRSRAKHSRRDSITHVCVMVPSYGHASTLILQALRLILQVGNMCEELPRTPAAHHLVRLPSSISAHEGGEPMRAGQPQPIGPPSRQVRPVVRSAHEHRDLAGLIVAGGAVAAAAVGVGDRLPLLALLLLQVRIFVVRVDE